LKKLFTIIFILFSFSGIYAQNFVQKFDGIPFQVPTGFSYAPFNGGMDNAKFQFVDIDNDGLKDLFVYDVDTSLYFYKNTGTGTDPVFKLITTAFQDLSFSYWFYFVDIDNDGDYDLFTGGDLSTIRFYRNTGTPEKPDFILEINELRSNSDTIIYCEASCVPTFCDINNNGKMDLFIGTSIGAITFYENIGTTSSFSFKFITDLWQNILIISPALELRHGANALEFADINSNNTFDLFFGDLFSKSIYLIRNDGTPSKPQMVIADSVYPVNDPFISLGYNHTRLAELYGNGLKDLFISVLYPAQNVNNFIYYKNTGTPTLPFFQRISDNYLNNVDVGSYSNIYFTDINNNGLEDLFIGSDLGKISYFRNNGTQTHPSFTLETDSIPLSITPFNFIYSPAFADIDNNGLKDLFVGSFIRDSLWFFRNTGTPENFQFTFEARGNQIGITNLTQSSTPTLVDIDNDGDLDFFSGGSNGRIYYYENTGTPQNFNFVFRSDFYFSIDVGNQSMPRFYDIDGDGDYDLFIGNQDGKIWYYKNDGTAGDPDFAFVTDFYKDIRVLSNSCPFFIDIDNDTDVDLFIGNVKGGIYFYENHDIIGIKNLSGEIPSGFRLYQNYPNPFNPSTKIKFELPFNGFISLTIYDINGKEIGRLINSHLKAGVYEIDWTAESYLSSGVYFYTLTSEKHSATNKMLLLK
jgi:hypothetical protein